jgi:hypothetical protein
VHLAQLDALNHKTFICWKVNAKTHYEFPKDFLRGHGIEELTEWLLTNRGALAEMLSCIPYPELWAWRLSEKDLSRWGCLVAYDTQLQELKSVAKAKLLSAQDAIELDQWIQRSSGEITPITLNLADSPQRWNCLMARTADVPRRGRPPRFNRDHWNVLHILPLAAPGWRWTEALGSHPTSHLVWYSEHDYVAKVCSEIVAKRDWSYLFDSPTGHNGALDGRSTSTSSTTQGVATNRN